METALEALHGAFQFSRLIDTGDADTDGMAAATKNLSIEQGTTFRLSFCWQASPEFGGAPRDLTGWKFRMQGRRKQQDPTLYIDATTENGRIIIGADPLVPGGETSPDPTNGWVTIKLSAQDTNALSFRSLQYDIEAITPGGEVYRLMKGNITIDPNITQESNDPVVEG